MSRGTRVRAVEDVFCASTAERPDHGPMIAWKSCYCKRKFGEFLLVRFNSIDSVLNKGIKPFQYLFPESNHSETTY